MFRKTTEQIFGFSPITPKPEVLWRFPFAKLSFYFPGTDILKFFKNL